MSSERVCSVQNPLKSNYLNVFAEATRSGKPVGTGGYNLAKSDGPRDNWSRCNFVVDPEWFRDSVHGGGSADLREMAARAYGMNSAEEIVFITGGTSVCNHHVCGALLSRGGIAVVERPTYEPLLAAVKASRADNALQIEADPTFELKRGGFEERYQIQEAEWSRVLALKPRVIVITDPNNPTGTLVQNMFRLAAMVDEHNASLEAHQQAYVLVDEVQKPLSSAPHAATYSRFFISTLSTTKAYGLSGLRMGNVLASEAVVEAVRGYVMTSSVVNSAASEGLWRQFFDARDELLSHTRSVYNKRLKFIRDEFKNRSADSAWCSPDAGNTFIVRIEDLAKSGDGAQLEDDCDICDDMKFAEELKEEFDTVVTPGSSFGMKGFVRCAFLCAVEDEPVFEGIRRLLEFGQRRWCRK